MTSYHLLQTVLDVGSTLALVSSLVVLGVCVIGLFEGRRNAAMLRQLTGPPKPAGQKLAPHIRAVPRETSQPSSRVA